MSVDIKFIPLSFMNSKEEILRQVRNTVLFSHLLNKFEETSLEDYLDSTQYGYTASALERGKHKFVRITDIKDGVVNWEAVPFCDCDSENKYKLKDKDILIARTGGTTGKSFVVNGAPSNAIFASYLIRLRLKKGVDSDFISFFLNSYLFWNQIVEMKSGTAIPNVNAEKLKSLRIPKCDNTTQKNISENFKKDKATEFSELFKVVEKIENYFVESNRLSSKFTHQLDLVKQLRQSFLREAMQGKLVKQDPKDGNASDLLKEIKIEKAKLGKKEKPLPPIKNEEIPFEIPKNWVWCRLGEITNIQRGSSPRPKGDPKYFSKETTEYNWITISDITDYCKNFRLQRTKEFITLEGTKHSRYVERDDFIIAVSGSTTGKCCITEINGYIYDGLSVIKIVQKSLLSEFLLKYMMCLYSVINSSKSGASFPNINNDFLNLLTFPLPPLPEQHRIVKKLEELMKYCDELEKNIQQSKSENEKLLQQVLREALSGEIK